MLRCNVDQFRQTVVLPQGAFRKVVTDHKERRAILAAIFRTERFAELGAPPQGPGVRAGARGRGEARRSGASCWREPGRGTGRRSPGWSRARRPPRRRRPKPRTRPPRRATRRSRRRRTASIWPRPSTTSRSSGHGSGSWRRVPPRWRSGARSWNAAQRAARLAGDREHLDAKRGEVASLGEQIDGAKGVLERGRARRWRRPSGRGTSSRRAAASWTRRRAGASGFGR